MQASAGVDKRPQGPFSFSGVYRNTAGHSQESTQQSSSGSHSLGSSGQKQFETFQVFICWKKMPPKVKARSIQRKKRKFTGNTYTRTTKSPESELSAIEKTAKNREDSISKENSGDDCKQTPSSAKQPSASVKKLGEQSDFSDSSIKDVPESIKGFHFVNISILASVFQLFWCPVCKNGHVVLEEDKDAKKGFASLLVVKCTSHKHSFSKQV